MRDPEKLRALIMDLAHGGHEELLEALSHICALEVPAQERDDALSDLLLHLWTRLAAQDSLRSIRDLVPFFRIVIRAQAINRRRALPGHCNLDPAMAAPGPPDAVLEADLAHGVRRRLESLLTGQVLAVFLLHLQKRTVEEIARELALSPGSVRALKRNMRRVLRRGLRDFLPE